MWRPEGFYKNLAMMPTGGENNTVEFVADALLEALRNEAFWTIDAKSKVEINDLKCNFTKGKIIFIPDEESTNG